MKKECLVSANNGGCLLVAMDLGGVKNEYSVLDYNIRY